MRNHRERAANAHLLRKQWLEVGLLSEVRQPLTQSRQPDVPTKQRHAYTILVHIDAHSARIRLGRYCKPTPAASKTGATNLPARTVPSYSSNGHSCAACNQTQLRTNLCPLRCANPLSEFSFDSTCYGNSELCRSACTLALRPPARMRDHMLRS